MKRGTLETPEGARLPIAIAETAAEESEGVTPYGPGLAMLFSRSGPVTMERTPWPLVAVWLAPLGARADWVGYLVTRVRRAMPGEVLDVGPARSRVLEVPEAWGAAFRPGQLVRVRT